MESKYFINKRGVKIVRCCASCASKHFDKGNQRICVANGCLVKKNGLCKSWQMAEHFDMAGLGDGQVKKKQYLDFIGRHRYTGKSDIFSVRAEFEKEHGSIYLNN